jgi:hypothetical protein
LGNWEEAGNDAEKWKWTVAAVTSTPDPLNNYRKCYQAPHAAARHANE